MATAPFSSSLNTKLKIQALADKVPISIAVLPIWIAVGFIVMEYSNSKAILEAITYFVATLIVACPCALGLALPMVLVVAGGIAARNGAIIKSAETTQRPLKAADIIFDKTGTIPQNDLLFTKKNYLMGRRRGLHPI
ncbi:hypothetical protein V2G26_009327 [Clonostachys chloroleuca]